MIADGGALYKLVRRLRSFTDTVSYEWLETLCCGYNFLQFLRVKKLTTLADLCADGVEALACSISTQANLTSLKLRHNGCGATGAAALARALPHLRKLRELLLEGNALNDAGVSALAPALPALKLLEHLDLKANGIGIEGATALEPALAPLLALVSLGLANNALGNTGVNVLLPVIRTIAAGGDLWVSVSGNNVGTMAQFALRRLPRVHLGERLQGPRGFLQHGAGL